MPKKQGDRYNISKNNITFVYININLLNNLILIINKFF